jgi:hypothetical protein
MYMAYYGEAAEILYDSELTDIARVYVRSQSVIQR